MVVREMMLRLLGAASVGGGIPRRWRMLSEGLAVRSVTWCNMRRLIHTGMDVAVSM